MPSNTTMRLPLLITIICPLSLMAVVTVLNENPALMSVGPRFSEHSIWQSGLPPTWGSSGLCLIRKWWHWVLLRTNNNQKIIYMVGWRKSGDNLVQPAVLLLQDTSGWQLLCHTVSKKWLKTSRHKRSITSRCCQWKLGPSHKPLLTSLSPESQ